MKKLVAVLIAAGLATAAPAFAKDYLKMSTLGPGSSPNLVMTTFATIVNQNTDTLEIQVNATGAAPKHAIQAAKGEVDLFMSSPLVHLFMTDGKAMYAKVPQAPELAKDLRALFNFPIGTYHIVVYEDSGIKSLKDIKGKKVFLGPPTGAARVVMQRLVTAVTGYEPGKDYEAVKLGWGAASQAFQDGQIDVYINPTNAPSPVIQQVALSREIRLLGIPEDMIESEEVVKLYKRPGGKLGKIPAGTYGENQVNESDVTTIAAVVGIGVGKHVPEDDVYTMLKAFWGNLDKEFEGTPWLRNISLEGAFDQLNIPLHPGALRYYEDAGVAVPE